ncbi:hypothetical protein DPEC_G00144630 [Dallia pectoralis]|uniref:Uncharacterized protein n=1 Tax=Dallia pectoralis TaxID=75939 RepID=A0ACC2GNI9_DALPE|nr:hypothetical protein DPEC_G00144630 [Dallia pectoralis]
MARASKTRALQRALVKLFEPGLDHGPLELELGDLLFQTFLEEFPTVRPCMTDGFIENRQLCLELSAMVSRVLLKFWTPKISFSKICKVREITPRLRHRQLDAVEPWSSTEDLGQSVDDTDRADGHSVDYGTEKKGVRGFFSRVWKTLKRFSTCGCLCSN